MFASVLNRFLAPLNMRTQFRQSKKGRLMTDMYVYHFMRCRGSAGEEILSKRRATLETIKGKGEAIMESQIVVDHREVDGNGFVIGGISDGSRPMDELRTQIRSLELRAKSRDSDALKLNEDTEGAGKYMLRLESRELRNQAKTLKKRLGGTTGDRLGDWSGLHDPVTFACSPAASPA
jgi:hypothetical protein